MPHIGIVHLADRRCPRASISSAARWVTVDCLWRKLSTTLQESGYDGPFDVKLIGPEIEANDYWNVLEQSHRGVRRAWPSRRPVLPWHNGGDARSALTAQIAIPRSELRFSFVRSSGPGGQNVNKVASKAVSALGSRPQPCRFPTSVRERFLARFRRRINDRGELIIASQRYRDQSRNVDDCLAKLREMLLAVVTVPKPRKKSKLPKAAREARLATKTRLPRRKSNVESFRHRNSAPLGNLPIVRSGRPDSVHAGPL